MFKHCFVNMETIHNIHNSNPYFLSAESSPQLQTEFQQTSFDVSVSSRPNAASYSDFSTITIFIFLSSARILFILSFLLFKFTNPPPPKKNTFFRTTDFEPSNFVIFIYPSRFSQVEISIKYKYH
jgi:hypothetical protein